MSVVVPVVVFVVLVAFLATVFLVVVVFVFATIASWERCEHFGNSHADPSLLVGTDAPRRVPR